MIPFRGAANAVWLESFTMRISIQACIESDDSSSPKVIAIGRVEHDAGVDPASGIGLFVQEAHEVFGACKRSPRGNKRTNSSASQPVAWPLSGFAGFQDLVRLPPA